MNPTWIFSFFANPTDQDLEEKCASILKTFEDAPDTNTGSVMSLGAFLGHVWAHWPERTERWFRGLMALAEGQKGRDLLYMALYLSPHDEAHDLLQSIGEASSDEEAQALLGLQSLPRPVPVEIEVIEPYHLDLHWGAYFGSGDTRHLEKIIEQLVHYTQGSKSSVRERGNAMAALWSLESNRGQSVHIDMGVGVVLHRRPSLADIYALAVNEYFRLHPGHKHR